MAAPTDRRRGNKLKELLSRLAKIVRGEELFCGNRILGNFGGRLASCLAIKSEGGREGSVCRSVGRPVDHERFSLRAQKGERERAHRPD